MLCTRRSILHYMQIVQVIIWVDTVCNIFIENLVLPFWKKTFVPPLQLFCIINSLSLVSFMCSFRVQFPRTVSSASVSAAALFSPEVVPNTIINFYCQSEPQRDINFQHLSSERHIYRPVTMCIPPVTILVVLWIPCKYLPLSTSCKLSRLSLKTKPAKKSYLNRCYLQPDLWNRT